MKFLQTADWHIGKKIHEHSLIKDQDYTFLQLKKIALENKVDAIVIAGDLYDRKAPSDMAIEQLSKMIKELNIDNKIPILAISGNHDSKIKLGQARQWFKATNFYINTKIKESFKPIEIKNTQFYLLPFFELRDAKQLFKGQRIDDLKDAIKLIIDRHKETFKPNTKHVLVTHFFVTDENKDETVGGLDAISSELFKDFDYVCLGHLHNKDALNKEKIKYSGSLNKFSISEVENIKGVWLVDLSKSKSSFKSLKALYDSRIIEGKFKDLMQQKGSDDYVYIRLYDEKIVVDAMNRLRERYPNILSLEMPALKKELVSEDKNVTEKLNNPYEFAKIFFSKVAKIKLNEDDEKILKETLKEAQHETD